MTDRFHNLAVAADHMVPLPSDYYRIQQGRISFAVVEASQGNTDLNGDGDASDRVLHIHDAPGDRLLNSGFATIPNLYFIDGDHVVTAVSEGAQGASDLNGDGDTTDNVLHLLELP